MAQEFRKFTYDSAWEMFPKFRESEKPIVPQVEAGEEKPEDKPASKWRLFYYVNILVTYKSIVYRLWAIAESAAICGFLLRE